MGKYDVVVIGAGNGGLTAALTLAGRGRKTLLLERHNLPGGCATSFIRGRFEFEVALHQLSGLGTPDHPGPLRTTLTDLGVMDKVEFVEQRNLYRVVSPGELDVTLKADRDQAAQALKEAFPDEARSIEDFFKLVWDFCNEWVCVAFLRDPEASPEKYPLYFKYALRPAQEILDHYFRDPRLKLTTAIYWAYMGLPPRLMPFMDLAMLLWAYCEFKPWHIKGGSQALSSALLDNYLAAGGEARFNCGAKEIKIENGKIAGVVDENGDLAETGYVVSNAGTLATYLELIDRDQAPSGTLEKMRSSTVGTSAFTAYLGLDCEPSELGLTAATNFICTEPDFEKAYVLGRSLAPPNNALLSCYDVDDPDFSEPGSCQAALVTMQYAEQWLSVPPDQYAQAKFEYGRGILALAEKAVPGLWDRIEEMELASPLTHMRYLGHPGGAIYGFDQFAKDSTLFLTPDSGIQGLYFAGAWVGSGGFQPTLMSGQSAAKAILKSMKSGGEI